jgi:hypothetical protein
MIVPVVAKTTASLRAVGDISKLRETPKFVLNPTHQIYIIIQEDTLEI